MIWMSHQYMPLVKQGLRCNTSCHNNKLKKTSGASRIICLPLVFFLVAKNEIFKIFSFFLFSQINENIHHIHIYVYIGRPQLLLNGSTCTYIRLPT